MSDTTTHDWFIEQIPAYITDGLRGEDVFRFRSHAAYCSDCAALLTQASQSDAELRGLFENIEPSAGFEDRLIQGLRTSQRGGRPWANLRLPSNIHPTIFRAAAAVAAVIVLGVGGYEASSLMQTGHMVSLGGDRQATQAQVASNLQQMGLAFIQYNANGGGAAPPIEKLSTLDDKSTAHDFFRFGTTEVPAHSTEAFGPTFAIGGAITSAGEGRTSSGKWAITGSGAIADGGALNVKTTDGDTLTFDDTAAPQAAGAKHSIEINEFYAGYTAANSPVLRDTFAPGIAGSNTYTGATTITGGVVQMGSGGTTGNFQTTPVDQSAAGANEVNEPQSTAENAANQAETERIAPIMSELQSQKDDLRKVIEPTGDRSITYFKPTLDIPGSQADHGREGQVAQYDDKADKALLGDRLDLAAANPNDSAPTSPAAPDAPPAPAESTPPSQAPTPNTGREIIRHGTLSFEVDSFDSAFTEIRKIADEESGFIDSTSSDKLANGKVSGTVTVRVPPDHLDTLILKLRGLGDLKGQKIMSDDITREYTDLQSELRAATAMEDRLLDIIKTGKGEVKDLVEAEKELGAWREKVEQVTGQINYYNNLISLSTLEISLTERDIRRAASATETETVSMGIETQDVVKARADALKAIDERHGHVTLSDLKQFEAGQLAATINASVAPDDAGPLVDNLRQIGRVARLDMGRQQTTADGQPVVPGTHLDRQDTQLQISIYNLANIQPRQTSNVVMACEDVELAYHKILDRVDKAGGRVVNSTLNRVTARQIDGAINFETPSDQADAVLADVRALGEVMNLSVTENPDAANVTDAKRGFVLTLASFNEVAPRETINLTIMPSGKVSDAYENLQAAALAVGADVTAAQLQEQNAQSAGATLTFDLATTHQADIEKALAAATGATGRVITRQSARSDDLQHTLAGKIQYALTLCSADSLAPRQTFNRTLVVSDVPDSYNAILAAAQQVDAKIVTAKLDQSDPQNPGGGLEFVVPQSDADSVEKAISATHASVLSRSVTRSADINGTTEDRIDLQLSIIGLDRLNPRQMIDRTLAVSDVPGSYSTILAAAQQANSKIALARLDASDEQNPQGELGIIVPLDGLDAVEKAIASTNAGVVSRTVARSSDLNNTTEERIALHIILRDVDHLDPRQTTTLNLLASDPEQQSKDLAAAAIAAGGTVISENLETNPQKYPVAHLIIDVPFKSSAEFLDRTQTMGTLQNIDQIRNPALPDADFTHARLDVTFGQDTGLWTSVKAGIGTSIQGLLYSLEFVVIGVCLVLPLIGAFWVGLKAIRRLRKKPAQSPAA